MNTCSFKWCAESLGDMMMTMMMMMDSSLDIEI